MSCLTGMQYGSKVVCCGTRHGNETFVGNSVGLDHARGAVPNVGVNEVVERHDEPLLLSNELHAND